MFPSPSHHEIDSEAIARIVGVSRSTVSKVIHNYPAISPATRAKVLKAIADYGYYPNLPAQIMAGQKTRTIGFFLFDRGHFSSDPLVNLMIASVIESAAACNYHILSYIIRDPDSPETRRMAHQVFRQGRIDGGVVIGARNQEPVLEELIADNWPLGIFDRDCDSPIKDRQAVVNLWDDQTAARAIDYVHGLGHRQIGLINGDLTRAAGRAKRDGFMQALVNLGLPARQDWMLQADFSQDGGYQAVRSWLASCPDRPSVLVAANDAIAFGAAQALVEHGVRIPEDIGLVGIDGHPLAAWVRPPLTTFAYDFQATMRQLVESLVEIIEERPRAAHGHVCLEASLVERESCSRFGS